MTTLVEVFTKKIINMIPQQAYEEAAQKLIHEICETIYKDKKPREEIVEIVENFIKTHLNNPADNSTGIKDAITDNIAKTTLDVYKDENINMLLLQKILLEEIGENGKPNPNGFFYKSLEKSINITNVPINASITQKSNISGGDNGIVNKNDDSKDEKKVSNKENETFAKKVVNELANSNVEIPLIKGGKRGDGDQFDFVKKNPAKAADVGALDLGIAYNEFSKNNKPNTNELKSNILNGNVMSKVLGMSNINDKDLTGLTTLADGTSKIYQKGTQLKKVYNEWKANQPSSDNGGHDSNVKNLEQGEQSNNKTQQDSKGILPDIPTDYDSGLKMPSVDMSKIPEIPNTDLSVLGQGINGLKEPIAEELVKKIQEKLPDKTIDSITVKRDIYKKILLVIQAHLQNEQGKEMLLSHINNVIQPEIDMLSNNNEIKKRLLKVIFKNKNSEIYKKLIEIIAKNTSNENNAETTDNTTINAGERFNTNIVGVIDELSSWINEKISPNTTSSEKITDTMNPLIKPVTDNIPNTNIPEDNIPNTPVDNIPNTNMPEDKINDSAIDIVKNSMIQKIGGNPTTKKRRTKNNKRKTMKHKKRRTKKHRKHK